MRKETNLIRKERIIKEGTRLISYVLSNEVY